MSAKDDPLTYFRRVTEALYTNVYGQIAARRGITVEQLKAEMHAEAKIREANVARVVALMERLDVDISDLPGYPDGRDD